MTSVGGVAHLCKIGQLDKNLLKLEPALNMVSGRYKPGLFSAFFLKIKKGRAIHCIFLVFNTLKQERMPFLSLIQLKIQIHFHVAHMT